MTIVRTRHAQLADGGEVDVRIDADDDRVVVSAWDALGNRVGYAECDARPSPHPREVEVEVTPAQRRRGIGTELLQTLLDEAARRGITRLTWDHPADDAAVRHLESATGVPCARRVEHGRTKSTIFVPAA